MGIEQTIVSARGRGGAIEYEVARPCDDWHPTCGYCEGTGVRGGASANYDNLTDDEKAVLTDDQLDAEGLARVDGVIVEAEDVPHLVAMKRAS